MRCRSAVVIGAVLLLVGAARAQGEAPSEDPASPVPADPAPVPAEPPVAPELEIPSVESTSPPTPECTAAVLDLEAGEGFTAERAAALSEIVTAEVAEHMECSVVSRSDIRAILDFEAERELLGCASESCLAELGSALGVGYVVTGRISKIRDSTLVSMRLLHLERMRVERRATDSFAGDDAELIDFLAWMSRRLAMKDPSLAGPKPVPKAKPDPVPAPAEVVVDVAPKGPVAVQFVERRTTLWRGLAWTGLVTTGGLLAVTSALAGSSFWLSNVLVQEKTRVDTDYGAVSDIEKAGPWVASGANLGLYLSAGLAVVTMALFFLPSEEYEHVTLPAGDAAKGP